MGIKTSYTWLLLFLLPVLFLSTEAIAQETYAVGFESFKTENIKRVQGLSQNMVNCIMQDERGFLWFGTWDGLNRFDGYTFLIFNKQNGMSNPTVNTLLQDDEGIIWIGTQDGLNRFDRNTNTFITYKNIPGESNSLSNNTINHIYQDHKGVLWISTVQGLNKLDKENNVYTRYSFNIAGADSIRTNWINKVIQDDKGLFWIATRFGMFSYNDSTHTFTPYFHDEGDPLSISNNNINDIYCDHSGRLWVGTQQGFNLLLDDHSGFRHYFHNHNNTSSISNNVVNAIFEDSRGMFWIGTREKLNLFDPMQDRFTSFSHSGKNTSISNDDIRCILEDDMGSVWVGTYNGANKVKLGLSKFNYYHRDPTSPNSLSSDIIHTIFKDDDGKIWLGTGKGLNIFDRESGKYFRLNHKLDPYTNLNEERVRALFKDSQGKVWIGTNSFGLLRYDPVTGKFDNFTNRPDDPYSLNGNGILCVLEDYKGYIWVGTNRGLNSFHPDSIGMRSWMHDPRDPKSLSHNQVWTMYQDSKNQLWFGTNNGLALYNPDENNFTSYTYKPEDPNSISANAVFGIYEDSKGNYWFGTMGGGLNHFDPQTQKFTSYTEENGLPNNVVYMALEDKQGNLWLTTNWGMSKFNPATKEIINFDIHDGLQGNEFNGGAWYHATDGEMFFGGMDGFNSFIPEEIKQNESPPRLAITSFKILNEPMTREFNNGDTIRLGYDDNFFSIEFSALDFTNPAKNMYSYILEGYEEEWNNRDADRRVAEYTRVEPGSYVFRVRGSNNDGIWNNEGISLNIIILPPWWDTLLFRIMFGAIIFALLWTFVYWRIRTIKRKHEVDKKVLAIEKELFDIQQKALQLQMNPHFIFNSLNAIQSFVISSNTDKAIHYLSKFSQLMRRILANSRESSIPLRDELIALKHYMDIERLRFDNKFNYEVIIDRKIDEEFMEIPPMIIQPFVENAILHGLIHSPRPGHIKVTLTLEHHYIFCTIEDNGVGREKAQEIKDASGLKRKSRGMLITKERLEILNKQNVDKFAVNIIDLKDYDGLAAGTRVELNILYIEE